MTIGYSAEQVASLLLSNTGLSEWQVGFLAVALDEVAEWQEFTGKVGNIHCYECADELTQMNSQHLDCIEPVIYALTGLSFSVSWRGVYGARTYFVEQHESRDLRPRADFEALHHNCGWGSNRHRRALRAQFNISETSSSITTTRVS